ncbi:hypothetical protein [Nocardia sp. SSK8]|uniref:hypothetical protein n=1 Tax=Nocardia sp. SSK8 TaxID=3120154 RepID=UPI0030099144
MMSTTRAARTVTAALALTAALVAAAGPAAAESPSSGSAGTGSAELAQSLFTAIGCYVGANTCGPIVIPAQ